MLSFFSLGGANIFSADKNRYDSRPPVDKSHIAMNAKIMMRGLSITASS